MKNGLFFFFWGGGGGVGGGRGKLKPWGKLHLL